MISLFYVVSFMINSLLCCCIIDYIDEYKLIVINGILLNYIELVKIKDEIMIIML